MIATTKVAPRVALTDKGSRRAMISSNCPPETSRRKVALAACFQSSAGNTTSLSNRPMASRAGTVSKPTASNRAMVNSPMANSKATAPPSTEAIPSKDTVVDMVDLLKARMAEDISRLLPRNTASAPVEVRHWGWEEGY